MLSHSHAALQLGFNTQCPIFDGPDQNWDIFQLDDIYANDGVLTCGPNGGFLNSNPFTSTPPVSLNQYVDNAKWFGYERDLLIVPYGGQLSIEWEMLVRVFNTVPNAFPDAVTQGPTDVRYGCGAANVRDFDSLVNFNFFVTNDRVYAVYERLPQHRGMFGFYAAFTYVIPVAKRCGSDWVKLKIVLDNATQSTRYYVNGLMVLEVFNSGNYLDGVFPVVDFGGIEEVRFPTSVNMGFGTFTGVDHYPAATNPRNSNTSNPANFPLIREALTNCGEFMSWTMYNPVLGSPNEASYWDPHGFNVGHHIWGQGVEVHIKKMEAYSITSCLAG